jgi:hypothetical protein
MKINHKIYQYCKISKKEIPFDVCLFSPDHDLTEFEKFDPHFHIIKKGFDWDLAISIPTIEKWKNNKELTIIKEHSSQNDWVGLTDVKEELINWLSKENMILRHYSNLYVVITTWNMNNYDIDSKEVYNDNEDLF